jgi:hypothetical protein
MARRRRESRRPKQHALRKQVSRDPATGRGLFVPEGNARRSEGRIGRSTLVCNKRQVLFRYCCVGWAGRGFGSARGGKTPFWVDPESIDRGQARF